MRQAREADSRRRVEGAEEEEEEEGLGELGEDFELICMAIVIYKYVLNRDGKSEINKGGREGEGSGGKEVKLSDVSRLEVHQNVHGCNTSCGIISRDKH